MGASNIEILIFSISLQLVMSADSILGNDVTSLIDVTTDCLEEVPVGTSEEMVVFGGNVRAAGRVTINWQSPGFAQYNYNGLPQWTPCYSPIRPLYAPYPFIPYAPITVPAPYPEYYPEFYTIPYPNSNPIALVPTVEYPLDVTVGPSNSDIYVDDAVSHDDGYLVPASGKVTIAAYFEN